MIRKPLRILQLPGIHNDQSSETHNIVFFLYYNLLSQIKWIFETKYRALNDAKFLGISQTQEFHNNILFVKKNLKRHDYLLGMYLYYRIYR